MDDSDLTLTELQRKNLSRIERVNKQGVQINGMENIYLTRLVEGLHSPEDLDRIRYEHETVMAEQLDEIEKQIRMQAIMNTNGKLG